MASRGPRRPPREGRVERTLGWAYEHGRGVYDAHGLFRSKDKFAPEWEPLFAAVPAGARLPRVVVAVARALLPPGAVRTALVAAGRREWTSARDRFAELQRPGPRGLARCWAPALVSTALVAVALATRQPFGPLPDAVVEASGWSGEQVLAGEVWRAATASLLTRDPLMLARWWRAPGRCWRGSSGCSAARARQRPAPPGGRRGAPARVRRGAAWVVARGLLPHQAAQRGGEAASPAA